jgi:hypothetical protein
MHQNFHSDIAEKCAHLKPQTTRYFHYTETMGAVHHTLSRRPLSSVAHSDTIDLFPTAITMSGTLIFYDIIGGGWND